MNAINKHTVKTLRTHASFNKIPTNYISVESLINLLYEKNIILAMFSLSMCQEAVRRETTEGSIEFIGYRTSTSKMAVQSYSQGINQQYCGGLFQYSDWLSRYSHLKLE